MSKPGVSKKKITLSTWVRIGVTVLIVSIILPKLNLNEFVETLKTVKWSHIIFLAAWIIVDRFFMAYKWNMLLGAKTIQYSKLEAFRIYLMAGAVGYLLPTGVGADFYRASRASRDERKLSDLVASILLERILGMVAIIIACIIGLSIIQHYFPDSFQYFHTIVLFMSILVGLIFMVSLHQVPLRMIERLLSRLPQNRLTQSVVEIHAAYLSFRYHPRHLLAFLGITLLITLLAIIMTKFAADALSLRIEFVYFLGLIPLINLLQFIPISIGGLGVQEGLYIFFLSQVGTTSTEAFSLALLIRGLVLVGIIPGLILFLLDSQSRRALKKN